MFTQADIGHNRGVRGLGSVFVLALVAAGCGSSNEAPPAPTSQQSQGSRAAFTVDDGNGATWAAATPSGDAYRLEANGTGAGKIAIESDRVKIKDAAGNTTAKVKAKDYGFKIYEDDETEVMKAKRKGSGFKIQSAEGTPLGELATKGAGGELNGEQVQVQDENGVRIVLRGGNRVGSVSGTSVSEKAASFLALTELPMPQRVAAMIYVQEHES